MPYEIVPYAPEFDAQIAQLQTHLWSGSTARNAAYLRWKYAENPFFDETLIHLALSDGGVVAMRGMFGGLWQVDATATCWRVPCADDLVVQPEHRNSGVAGRVARACVAAAAARGFPFAVSLNASPATFVSSLAAGWRAAGSYESVWRYAACSPRLERLRSRMRHTPWRHVHTLLNRLRPNGLFAVLDRAGRQMSGPLSLGREPRPQEMADLVAHLPWDGRIRHVRDAAYFAWRFRNPLHDYRFLFWDDDGLHGYLVLQRYLSDRADQGCINIADWEASDEHVRAALLDAALRCGRFHRVQAWTASVPEPVRTVLRDQGFRTPEPSMTTRHSGLLVHRLSDASARECWPLGSRNLLNIADWDLRMLYSMAA